MQRSVIIWGGGGHAKVVYDALKSQGRRVISVIDSKYSGDFFGIPRSAEYDATRDRDCSLVVAIGDNKARKKLALQCQHSFDQAIHQSVLFAENVKAGEGSMVLHGVIVQTDSVIGKHVILNTGCQIDHDCRIDDFAHVAPGSVLCGNVTIGEGALVGAGAVVTPGVTIGAWAVVGAGAVVVSDVPEYATVAGVPARMLKSTQGSR